MDDKDITALEKEIERELRGLLEALLVGPEALACEKKERAA